MKLGQKRSLQKAPCFYFIMEIVNLYISILSQIIVFTTLLQITSFFGKMLINCKDTLK